MGLLHNMYSIIPWLLCNMLLVFVFASHSPSLFNHVKKEEILPYCYCYTWIIKSNLTWSINVKQKVGVRLKLTAALQMTEPFSFCYGASKMPRYWSDHTRVWRLIRRQTRQRYSLRTEATCPAAGGTDCVRQLCVCVCVQAALWNRSRPIRALTLHVGGATQQLLLCAVKTHQVNFSD